MTARNERNAFSCEVVFTVKSPRKFQDWCTGAQKLQRHIITSRHITQLQHQITSPFMVISKIFQVTVYHIVSTVLLCVFLLPRRTGCAKNNDTREGVCKFISTSNLS